MDVERKVDLVARGTAEVITREELRQLLETTSKPRAYWGFELSGFLHLGNGLVCGTKIKDMVEAGFDFTILLADWHSWINNKLGGDMAKIRMAGEYFKDGFTALGIDPTKASYVWASDIVEEKSYWETVIKVAKSITLQRTWRSLPIMGRSMELTDIETAWMYYPCMQAADIFAMEIDVACAGLDQRKAHMLARDAAEKLNLKKPICVHTPLLTGLGGPSGKTDKRFDEDSRISAQISSKMSKSIPTGCVFIHDAPEEIRAKIRGAFCPPKQIDGNPVLEVAKHVIFPTQRKLEIARPEKYGGAVSYEDYLGLTKDYKDARLHPLDLKNGVAEALIDILEPVRDHFKRHPDLLERMKQVEITR